MPYSPWLRPFSIEAFGALLYFNFLAFFAPLVYKTEGHLLDSRDAHDLNKKATVRGGLGRDKKCLKDLITLPPGSNDGTAIYLTVRGKRVRAFIVQRSCGLTLAPSSSALLPA